MLRTKISANGRGTRWRHVKTHGDALQLRARSRIKLHDERIVAWNDMTLVRRKGEQPVKALQHFSDVEGRCERSAACHVLVEMGDVGGEHDKSAAGLDPNELKPRRMAPTACTVRPGASSAVVDAVPQIAASEARQRSREFSVISEKRLFQHYPPEAAIRQLTSFLLFSYQCELTPFYAKAHEFRAGGLSTCRLVPCCRQQFGGIVNGQSIPVPQSQTM
jgi:hypothetical protein